jgi:hypothetical protein
MLLTTFQINPFGVLGTDNEKQKQLRPVKTLTRKNVIIGNSLAALSSANRGKIFSSINHFIKDIVTYIVLL